MAGREDKVREDIFSGDFELVVSAKASGTSFGIRVENTVTRSHSSAISETTRKMFPTR
jgi:hypothetical protein